MAEEEIDQNIAKKLLVEGGTLVFLDLPTGTEFGIDMNIFCVGEKFQGMKMIPPGLHFIFYSAVSKEGNVAPRTGFFHVFSPREILVKKWDVHNEEISEDPIDEEQYERIRSNLKGNLDRCLGIYPYHTWKTWIGLTSHITESLLENLQPVCGVIRSVCQFIPQEYPPQCNSKCEQKTSQKTEDNLLPDMQVEPGTEIRFTKVPDQRFPCGSTPSEITKHNMDSSYMLEQMLSSYSNPEDVLGELQLAFVCFILGQVYDAFEAWKKLVHILSTSDEALEKHAILFRKLITVLHFQLKEIPKDFFVDIVSNSNFLTSTLQIFFSNLEQSNADKELKKLGCKFKGNLTKNFKWDFESEPDDEKPVVVDL